jgi:hypothetical protein
VNLPRFLILTLGPVAVIAAAYVIAFPHISTAEVGPSNHSLAKSTLPHGPPRGNELGRLCQVAQESLKQQLPSNFQIIVRPPFILAGDLPVMRIKKLHDDVIAPVARALQATYFEHPPKQPITIVICSTEVQFRELARVWDGHLDGGYHGYYQRNKRRILLDLEAGNGSLAHELTHALSQSDCEDLPEWFDEGLAALHEDAAFSTQQKCLIGSKNWRCRVTEQALKAGQLPNLAQLTQPAKFRTGDVNIRYAMARSVCLFLQDRGLLARFYKDLRNSEQRDPTGLKSLCEVLKVSDVATADEQFHLWVRRAVKPKI